MDEETAERETTLGMAAAVAAEALSTEKVEARRCRGGSGAEMEMDARWMACLPRTMTAAQASAITYRHTGTHT